MSHRRLRKENKCLNCGAEVIGRFCHECGQENAEAKETIWHLLHHFFSDLTHFDSKLLHTFRYLTLKPGFLSKEYNNGRRVRYVYPLNLYFFTSAIFFLVFSSLVNLGSINTDNGARHEKIEKLDSLVFQSLSNSLAPGRKFTRKELNAFIDSSNNKASFGLTQKYTSRKQYDSLIKSGKKHHNWIERQFMYKSFELNDRFGKNSVAIGKAVLEEFFHSIPKMMFVLLPLFALMLKLLYIRRKEFYYIDHMIFTLHLYVFTFIALLVIFGLNKINASLHWTIVNYLVALVTITIFFYFYKALRNYYRQSRTKTILKFIAMIILFFIITTILFIVFLLLSIFQI